MDSSREDSPDWLRSFQAPTRSAFTISSDSDSLPNVSPSRDVKLKSQSTEVENNDDIVSSDSGAVAKFPADKNSKAKVPKRGSTGDGISPKKKRKKTEERQGNVAAELVAEEATSDKPAANHSVWALSSDSESGPDNSSRRETQNIQLEESVKDQGTVVVSSIKSLSKKTLKEKSPKKLLKAESGALKKEKNKTDNGLKEAEDNDETEVADEDISEKCTNPQVSTSRLPLLLSEKVNRSKALIECEGDSIDLSGDMGAVGRVVFPDSSTGNNDMYLDLKGTIYRTTIVPCRTFCVVSFGQSEAKIEAIMNDFIQLKAQSNVYEAETMVEGTLEGFSFDSDDEVDKMPKKTVPTDQNEGNEEQTNGKSKRKTEKSSGVQKRKGKTGGSKAQPAKRTRNKAQTTKKSKTKK